MGSQIQNPFDSGAGYFGNALNQFNRIDLGGSVADLGRTINAGNLSDLMAQNGGLANQGMNPLAMLATPEAQKTFQSDLALQRTDRQLGISQQNADTSLQSALWGHQDRQATNKLGWANHELSKGKFAYDKKNQFMLDMSRFGQLKNTYDKGLQNALAMDNYMPGANVAKYKQDNQWMLDASRKYMQNHPDTSKYIAQAESGGSYTAKNPKSTAYGKFQHLDYIRKTAVKRGWVKDDAEARTPAGQEKIQQKLNQEYATGLKKLGVPVTNETMLAVHQWGYPTFEKAVKGQLTKEDVARIAHTKAYKMFFDKKPEANMLDADTAKIGDTRYRDANVNAAEMLFNDNVTPSKLSVLQEQANTYGIDPNSPLNAVDQIRAMGVKQRKVLELYASGASPEEIKAFVENFDPKQYSLNAEAEQEATRPASIQNLTATPRTNFMGQPIADKYGRPLADMSINGTPTNEILSRFIPGFKGNNQFSKKQHELTNIWHAVSAHSDNKRKNLIKEQIKVDPTTPLRISSNGFTPGDIEVLKEDQLFRKTITDTLAVDVSDSLFENTNVSKTIGKLSTAINALPKNDPYRAKLEGLRKQITMANSGNPLKIEQWLKEEAGEDAEGFFNQFKDSTLPGLLSDFADTLSEGVTDGGAGIDFPGMWDNWRSLTDPDVYAAISSAYTAITKQPFTWRGLEDMIRSRDNSVPGWFSDVKSKSDSQLATLINKVKESYQRRTGNKINIGEIRKQREQLHTLQRKLKNNETYIMTPSDKELLKTSKLSAKELKQYEFDKGKPRPHAEESREQVYKIRKALGYDTRKQTKTGKAIDELIAKAKRLKDSVKGRPTTEPADTPEETISKLKQLWDKL